MTTNSNFYFSGANTVELAQKYGTPLYVMSEDIIREKINNIREAFLEKYPGTKLFYAGKAFLSLCMCHILIDENVGLDAVSGGEIHTALKAGVKSEDIIFHGNNKSVEEIIFAVSNSVGKIVADSIAEIELLSELASVLGKEINLLIRINPSIEIETHQYMNTGRKDSKFGVPLTMLMDAVKLIRDSSGLNYCGLHFHLGSQLYRPAYYISAVRKAAALMKEIRDELHLETKVLNIGGGYGVDYIDSEQTVRFSAFMDEIMNALHHHLNDQSLPLPEVYIEPGRWVTADSGITLYTVGTIKEIPGTRTYISVDGGMPDNLRPSLYGAKYRALIANKVNLPEEKPVTVAGKCCETGDILIHDIVLPKAERGDILAVMNTGAYNYSMCNNYNMTPKPALVFIRNGKDRLVIRRQTYEDLLAYEVIEKGEENE